MQDLSIVKQLIAKLSLLTVKLWWVLIAIMPVVLWHGVNQLLGEVGCPSQGDCYQAGWWAAYTLDLWISGLAILVWPVCFWQLGGRWLSSRFFKFEPLN